MRVGTVKELKTQEHRVGITPSGVRELVAGGHDVIVETSAGAAIGYNDEAYLASGAKIEPDAQAVFAQADLIVKVKEPQPQEIYRLRPHQTLFTYLHLAPDPEQAQGLMRSGATCIAYETVTDRHGRLPLLTPMSEVAGRLSVHVGSRYLDALHGGKGILLGGVTGVEPARVLIIGGGVSGRNAADMAIGLGADVTILDRSLDRLRELGDIFGRRARCLYASVLAIDELLPVSDLVIGAVLVPGAAAPHIATRAQIARMTPGSVLVDIAIDQGGCFETSRPTTHLAPTYVEHGITHYCVTNMPAAVARTATQALTNATLPYVLALANQGPERAMQRDSGLAAGLNVCGGRIANPQVAEALGYA